MTIINKSDLQDNSTHISDICIVGSGMSAQILAAILNEKKNKEIIIIESGKFEYDRNIQILNTFYNKGLPIMGDIKNDNYYEFGKEVINVGELNEKTNIVRRFGGAANYWANQIMLFNKIDIDNREWIEKNLSWNISFEELNKYYFKVINFVYGKLFENIDLSSDFLEKKYYSYLEKEFLKDNIFKLANTFHPKKIEKFNHKSEISIRLLKSNKIKIFNEFTATNINFHSSSNIVKNIDIQSNMKKCKIQSKIFILSCGALENARILLNNSKNKAILKNDLIGKYFMDHPVTNLGILKSKKKLPLSSLLGIKKKNYNYKKVIRFSEKYQEEKKILNSHLHINPKFGTVDLLAFQKFLLELNKLIKLKGIPKFWIPNLNLKKLIEQIYLSLPHNYSNSQINNLIRLFFEKNSYLFSFDKMDVAYHGEQAPNINSKIYLNERKDMYEQNFLNIDWKLSNIDHLTQNNFTSYLNSTFKKNNFFEFVENNEKKIFDQKHHIGTTRMGADKYDGVVDKNCKIFDVENLYISGSSAFRTSGSSNPGFTIMAMSQRLAEYINDIL